MSKNWPSLQDAAVEVPVAKELVRPSVVPSSFKRRRDVNAGLPELMAFGQLALWTLWTLGFTTLSEVIVGEGRVYRVYFSTSCVLLFFTFFVEWPALVLLDSRRRPW